MAQKITLKQSSTPFKVPTTSDLDLGELAVNTADGKIYFKKDNGTPAIVELGAIDTGDTGGEFLPLTGGTLHGDLTVTKPDNSLANVSAVSGGGNVYVGESVLTGGGMGFDGDGTAPWVGAQDKIAFYRRSGGVDTVVFDYPENDSVVDFKARPTFNSVGLATLGTAVTAMNGYTVNNDSGIIYQWGSVNIAGTTTTTVNFNIIFPTECTSIQISQGGNSSTGNRKGWGIADVTQNQFLAVNGSSVAGIHYWMAIGY